MTLGQKLLALKKKPKTLEKNLTITRQHIVDAVTQYLVSNSLWDDGKEITNIQFTDLFGASDVELCSMKITYIKEDKKKG